MDIYIEYVIIDNFVIDFCIILAVLKTLSLKISKWRIVLACVIGTALAIVIPLFKLSDILTLLIKVSLSFIMVITFSRYKSKKKFVFAMLLFYTYTFLMGGACLGLLYLINGDIDLSATFNYSSKVPIGLIVIAVLGYVYLINLIVRFFKKRRDVINFLYKVHIYYKENDLTVTGFLDSGNRLYYKENNAPAIIINLKTALRLIKMDETDFFIQMQKNLKYITFSTINNKDKKMPVIISDKIDIFINGQTRAFENIPLCISFKDFNDAEKYDALLHPAFLN